MKITESQRRQLIKLAFSKSSKESLEKIIESCAPGSFNRTEAQRALDLLNSKKS